MSQPQESAANQGPAWYSDPTGEFDLRWWDGHAWSEHVYGSRGRAFGPGVLSAAAGHRRGRRIGAAVALLAVSALPTVISGYLLWLAVTTALSNPIEGMATFSFWFMAVLSSLAAAALAIVAVAMTQDEAVTRRARRTLLGLGLGVITINAALVVGPVFAILVGATIQ